MVGKLALAVAIVFTLLAAWRLRAAPRWLLPALMATGVGGGVLAIVHWANGADSRWLVGGILLVLGESAALFATRVPALRVVTLVLGMLATALIAIATATVR